MSVIEKFAGRLAVPFLLVLVLASTLVAPRPAFAMQPAPEDRAAAASARGGEASLVLPDLSQVDFHGVNGRTLLMGGLVVCAFGLLFGLVAFTQLKNLPVHPAMLEVSELIYETCKTYLITQGKFILLLELFIGVIMVFYFGFLEKLEPIRVVIILVFSLIGIAGSYGVAWFGIRVNTFANSRAAFASLRGKPFPDLRHSAALGHEHRHAAHQRRAAVDVVHPAVHSRLAGRPVFHRLRHRRVARARRRCASRAASSRRSPTSGPT